MIGDALDEEAVRLRQVEHSGQVVGEQPGRYAGPERPFLQEHPTRHVGCDHEPQPLKAARLRDDMAHEADHLPVHVEHRPAGVPLVDGRVGLEELRLGQVVVDGVGLVAAADVAGAEGVTDPVGRADDEDRLTNVRLVGIAQRRDQGPLRHRVQLEERDVGVRLGGDDPRPLALASQKLDGDRVGEMNDVRRRHHLPVLRDQHAGADLAELHELALVRDLLLACPDDHDRRTHVLEDLGQVLSGRGRQGRGDRSERHEQDHRAFHAHPPPLTLDGWS